MEEQSIEISNIIKDFYVDISKYDKILKQIHLLRDYEKIIVQIFKISNKIVNIHFNASPIPYFSNTISKKSKFEYSSKQFDDFKNATNRVNMNYQEVYMSVFNIDEDEYYIEHNELLNDNEIQKIKLLNK